MVRNRIDVYKRQVLFLAFGLYIWNRMKVGKKQVKTEPEIILEEITQEEEKVPIEKLRWEKSHITAELKEKRIQYDNLGEQLAELDEVNEQMCIRDRFRRDHYRWFLVRRPR